MDIKSLYTLFIYKQLVYKQLWLDLQKVKQLLGLKHVIYKQPVYKQLELDSQKVKQLLGIKHITISNFANKLFAYENIVTTLHTTYHILYTVNQYIVQNGCHSFF